MVSAYIQETESPEFATVTEIFVLPTKKVLLGVKTLDVVDFYSHYHAWAVKHSENRKIVPFGDLCSHQLLHARTSTLHFGIIKLVSMKYTVV